MTDMRKSFPLHVLLLTCVIGCGGGSSSADGGGGVGSDAAGTDAGAGDGAAGAGGAAGVSCDTSRVLCKIATPQCAAGQVPSVNGVCYGPCVSIDMCTCVAPANCPDPSTTTCHMNTMRCGPFVN
jgi:hypothetical protein